MGREFFTEWSLPVKSGLGNLGSGPKRTISAGFSMKDFNPLRSKAVGSNFRCKTKSMRYRVSPMVLLCVRRGLEVVGLILSAKSEKRHITNQEIIP